MKGLFCQGKSIRRDGREGTFEEMLRADFEKRLNNLERDKLALEERIARCVRSIRDDDATLKTARPPCLSAC